jgi:hypothetical protein
MIYAIKIIQKFDGSINYEEKFAKNIRFAFVFSYFSIFLRLKEDFPFLVKFNETFSEKETSRFFIVMEFCRDGDLSSLISFAKKMNFKLDTMVFFIFVDFILNLFLEGYEDFYSACFRAT